MRGCVHLKSRKTLYLEFLSVLGIQLLTSHPFVSHLIVWHFPLYILNAFFACFEKVMGSGKQGAGEDLREFESCASSATDLLVTMDKSSSSLSNCFCFLGFFFSFFFLNFMLLDL